MTIMADKQRYYNPGTLIIEWAQPGYAAVTGLVEYPEGPEYETEVNKRGVTRAVLAGPDLTTLKKVELQARATDLGLDATGTKDELIERIQSHVCEIEGDCPKLTDGEELSGNSADGETENDPQKEG